MNEGGEKLEWAIREVMDESESLTHYGVKGMRWGVRKEYEKKRRTKRKSSYTLEEFVDDYQPTSVGADNHSSSAFVDSIGIYYDFLDKAVSSPAFLQFCQKKTDGKTEQLMNDYKDTFDKAMDINLPSDERTKYKAKSALIGKQLKDIMGEFDRTHMNDLTEEELEAEKEWGEMVDYLSKFDESMLGKGATIIMQRWWNGYAYQPVYVYRGKDGHVKSFKPGEEADLEAYAKSHKDDAVDFRKSTLSRTREKNISSSKKVSVKKGAKIDVSDEERLAKSLIRGTERGKVKAATEYLTKHPELIRKVAQGIALNKK